MPIDWNSKESYQRLLAAVYAASPQNHNYRLIATMFGEGATYDAIEGRFRKIKADAAKLKAEVESGQRPEAPARGVKSAPTTPRKRKAVIPEGEGVINGRVTKSKTRTPGHGRKKAAATQQPEIGMTEGSEGASFSFTQDSSFAHVDWENGVNGGDGYEEDEEE